MTLFMCFILNHICWAFVCLLSDLFSTTLYPGFNIPGNCFPQAPFQTQPKKASDRTLEREEGRSQVIAPLLSVSDGVWQQPVDSPAPALQPFLRDSSPSLEVLQWFQIIPGGPSTRITLPSPSSLQPQG